MNYSSLLAALKSHYPNIYSDTQYYTNISNWLDWYKGYIESIHTVRQSNGLTTPTRKLFRLNMAKRACEDWVSTVLAEPLVISIKDSTDKASIFIQGHRGNGGVLASNNFQYQLADTLEKTFALGTGALVLGVENIRLAPDERIVKTATSKITISSYNATQIIPLSYSNGVIMEAGFISELSIKGKLYYTVTAHIKDIDGTYNIENRLYDDNYKEVALPEGVLAVLKTGSTKPLFTILKTPLSNNISLNSPLGISIYHNAQDLLRGIDTVYDSTVNEIVAGQMIILMNTKLLARDSFGNPIAPQGVRQSLMQFFGDEGTDVSEYIKEFTPNLRTEALDKELQNQLDLYSSAVGLGSKFYNFTLSSGVTATEYLGGRQDFVRNAGKFTTYLCQQIKQLISGIIFIGNHILGLPINIDAGIVVEAQDNIVELDSDLRSQDRQDVAAGLMTKKEYRMKWFRETEEEASRKLKATGYTQPVF